MKDCFSNLKYLIAIQTRQKKLFLKIIGEHNQLPITFLSDLVCNKTHTNF